jgi:two-component system chemotaxis sensor kinase CheA
MHRFFSYLVIGIEQACDEREAQRLRLTHGIYVTLGVITAPYAVLFGLLGVKALAVGVVPIASVYLAAPLVTRRFGFVVTRLIQFTLFPFVVALYSSGLGEGTLIHLLYFPAVALPFLVTSLKERALLAYGVAMPMVMYAALVATDFTLLGTAALAPEVQRWVGLGLVPTTFAILLSAVAFFAVSTAKAQARLDQRTAEMSLVLENVDQALVTIDREGRLSSERSKAFDAWFGAPRPDDSLWTFFERVDAKQASALKLGFEQLVDGFLPVEVALEQLPSRYLHGGRTFQLKLSPVGGEPWSRFLVVNTDVTDELARRAAEAEQADFSRAVQHLALRRRPFLDALVELGRLVDELGTASGEALLRVMHTVKGNAAVWGLEQLARAAHVAEEQLLTGETEGPLAAATVREAWGRSRGPLEPLLGDASALELPRAEVESLVSLAEANALPAVQQLARTWLSEPLAPRFEHLADQARALARRLGRGEVTVKVAAVDVRVEPKLARTLPGLLVHLVRNAIDHGHEAPFERDALLKPPHGSVWLWASAKEDALVVVVRDDGRGVDWRAVADKARARGLPADSHAHLVEALFTDGLSTRDEATEVSGRGVGLSAVKAGIEALGGFIDVHSERGVGTTFTIRLPHQPPTGVPATQPEVRACA